MSINWPTSKFLRLIKLKEITLGELQIGDIVVSDYPFVIDWVQDDDENHISFFDEDDNGYMGEKKNKKITIIDRKCLVDFNFISKKLGKIK